MLRFLCFQLPVIAIDIADALAVVPVLVLEAVLSTIAEPEAEVVAAVSSVEKMVIGESLFCLFLL